MTDERADVVRERIRAALAAAWRCDPARVLVAAWLTAEGQWRARCAVGLMFYPLDDARETEADSEAGALRRLEDKAAALVRAREAMR